MSGPAGRAALFAVGVAVTRYAPAPVLAFLILRYRPEPGNDAGMATGAALGSVFPVVGTAVGAVVGIGARALASRANTKSFYNSQDSIYD